MTSPDFHQLVKRVPRYTSYPTAPHFDAVASDTLYRRWLSAIPATDLISVYIHIPFCAALCLYCGCTTRVVRGVAPIDKYLTQLETEIGLVRDALPRRLLIGHLHLGGGTPNRLNPQQFRQLWGFLLAAFDVAETAEISVELDPREVTVEQAETLAALGVNRVSLGVQDFDAQVQAAVNRVQPFTLVADAVASLRRAGISAVNLDLMYGLPHQSVDSVARSVDLASSLAPDRISLFGYAHVPWIKRHQSLLDEASLPGPEERRRQEQRAAEELVARDYHRIGLDHFAKAADPMALSQKRGDLHRNFQGYTTDRCDTLLGFGASSIGSVRQGYVQNHTDLQAYGAALRDGRLPLAKARALTTDDRFRRDIIERLMCDLAVDLESVAARHHEADPSAIDLAGVDALAAAGLCERTGYAIVVPERHRALVRLVAAEFDAYLRPDGARHSLAV